VPGYVDPVPGNNEAWRRSASDPTATAAATATALRTGPAAARGEMQATVKAGGDAPETIDIDLGGYQGTAKFSWENFTIKDRMKLSGGGQLIHDTQCVGGSGTMDFPAAGLASVKVEVEPNCDGNTSGTAWEFKVECPPIQLEFAPKPPTMVTPPVLSPHGQVKQGDTCVDVTPPAAEPAPEPAPKKVPSRKKKPPVIKRQPSCPPGYYYNRRARRCVPVRGAPQPPYAAMPVWHDPDRTALRAHPDPS
jgi:hypothetical protein